MPIDIMLVANVAEPPLAVLRQEHGNAEGMDGRVTEPFIEEATAAVEPVEIRLVAVGAEEIQGSDLEVGEELAVIVVTASSAVGVKQPIEVSVRVDEFRMCVDEGAGAGPERREGAGVVEDVHVEAVFEIVVAHEAEDVIVDVAEEVDVRFDAPVPVEVAEAGVLVEEARVPAAHVPVGYHPAFADADGAEVFERVHEARFVDPGG